MNFRTADSLSHARPSTSGRSMQSCSEQPANFPLYASRLIPHGSSVRAFGHRGDITLLDYGAGNVRSIRNAVKRLGYKLKEVNSPKPSFSLHSVSICSSRRFNVWPGAEIEVLGQVRTAADILEAERLLFPGVGAFEQAMGALKDRGYTEALKEYVKVEP